MSLCEPITEVSCPLVDSESMPTKRRNKTKANHEEFKMSLLFIFLFSTCPGLALLICRPCRIFLFAFISSMDYIPHFSLFPGGGLRCSVPFSGTGIPCLPFDLCMPFVFMSGHKYAFSSERKKNQFPLS